MGLRFISLTGFLLFCGVLAGQNSPQVKKTAAVETSPASGKEMYLQYCASCHGKDGKGGGPAAVALKTAPSNLTTLAAHNNGSFPDVRVSRLIEGTDQLAAHGSHEMPIWGQVFHQMDGMGPSTMKLRVANLTGYLKALQAK
jgi:mono/diheme cytochrome c family protein